MLDCPRSRKRRATRSAASTTTRPSIPWRVWKSWTIGSIVKVSALLPSKQPTSRGNPFRFTNKPTMICGSTRRSLENPGLRSPSFGPQYSSSFSASKYKVVTSYNTSDKSPALEA
ncbi:hypothetical protein FYJ63_02570 [Mobiluncus holmesii]|uniref:Uncharacterized protein n=1 Tax=Mobiluncus porci TaxID=2652278 RepID=A0A7K0K0Y0_9ACTO|nr:hypothetical protein [Mobiluncus porci]